MLSDQLIIDVYFSDNTLVEILKAGHWLHAENSKDFYNSVCQFLG
jgi:esterase